MKSYCVGAEEMALGFRALAALPEDMGTLPCIHVAGNIGLFLQLQGIRCPLLASINTVCIWYKDIYASKIPIQMKKNIFFEKNVGYLGKVGESL